uniref:Anti-silencing function protein 1 n=1 Tax=Trieres chinensis TaxID=1514140 RepID=A0A7S2EDZ3_TRICV|mmetsp:Transcript_19642/g.39806  ORF Transcript_19642/g.39806 Transcript_19642/m.39806 type:complete len:211 (+) Transcript_19642:201-833(+)|eukprot:CAMPEP_0183308636 /NCGR_PEP_ID=MMETSP0160_2-20130417/22372_1 /TAXON_ID=2839 ORGANISM="Odontella Sinensis, Strain Grunow 1884" /NCGR_SAMPLE_ID=MMETSP0160_2 /ASSEMBLY_ACC=CAM_ASM_000250 /LENGTH=210 /DNA_ID=CAMNT_0025472503 /DNA_START=197 /DNA_END=829 /DNA_ORIENTATION=-
MALVNVVNMTVLDNPTSFRKPFQFEVTFECLQELEDDIEWKVIYVGSAESSSHDQVLDEILVGPVPVGINKFVLEADPPDVSSIPQSDILGVTVALVTCSYKDQEFTRVGYYVNNEYSEEFDPEVGPPEPLDLSKVVRTILADKPRVTRFPIAWNKQDLMEQQQKQESSGEDVMNDESDADMTARATTVSFSPDVIVTPEPQIEDAMILA